MKGTDDKHSDHELKAYLEGRDGVSAAYRATAHEEPPAALDQFILNAAHTQAQPTAEPWYARRKPYAFAASVMVAVAALSLYVGTLDDIALAPEAQQQGTAGALDFQRVERIEEAQPPAAEASLVRAEPEFDARQLAPAVPAVSVADRPVAPAPPPAVSTDALAVSVEVAPAMVINGPLLEEIEADAAAAQVQQQSTAAGQLTVTGSRIVRRDEGDVSYRESREAWLDEIRFMADELDTRSRLVTARRSSAVLEQQLEEEIELFLDAWPDTDIDAELEQ